MNYQGLRNILGDIEAEKKAKKKIELQEQLEAEREKQHRAEMEEEKSQLHAELEKGMEWEPQTEVQGVIPVQLEPAGNSGVSGQTTIPNQDVNKEPGRQEERRGYFCAIWERLGKPKQNTKIWSEIKKLSKQKDDDSGPVREVIGREEFYFRYEDGSIENIVHKTFQNDMSAIRKEK